MLAEEAGAFERLQSNLLGGTKKGAATRDSGCLSAHRCAWLELGVGEIGQAESQGRSECSRRCWWFVVTADIVDMVEEWASRVAPRLLVKILRTTFTFSLDVVTMDTDTDEGVCVCSPDDGC